MAKTQVNQDIQLMYEQQEKEKKRAYNEHDVQAEHGGFIPLTFSATGGIGRECRRFSHD